MNLCPYLKVGFLEERVTGLAELNQSLEAQLEEQQAQIAEAFEMRCVLQKIHLHLEERENEVNRLQSELTGALNKIRISAGSASTPPLSDIVSDDEKQLSRRTTFKSDHTHEGGSTMSHGNTDDRELRNDNEVGSDDEDDEEHKKSTEEEQKSSDLLLSSFVARASEAEMQLEIEELKSQLEKVNQLGCYIPCCAILQNLGVSFLR